MNIIHNVMKCVKAYVLLARESQKLISRAGVRGGSRVMRVRLRVKDTTRTLGKNVCMRYDFNVCVCGLNVRRVRSERVRRVCGCGIIQWAKPIQILPIC